MTFGPKVTDLGLEVDETVEHYVITHLEPGSAAASRSLYPRALRLGLRLLSINGTSPDSLPLDRRERLVRMSLQERPLRLEFQEDAARGASAYKKLTQRELIEKLVTAEDALGLMKHAKRKLRATQEELSSCQQALAQTTEAGSLLRSRLAEITIEHKRMASELDTTQYAMRNEVESHKTTKMELGIVTQQLSETNIELATVRHHGIVPEPFT